MNLHTIMATKNECYICNKDKHIKVNGIMVHSTGANNPYIKRYVAPDDGKIGQNKYNNSFNEFHPGGQQICPHAVIGLCDDGVTVGTYQILPYDIVGWHSGSGSKGYNNNANNTGYIGFEICEDDTNNKAYLDKVYNEAVEFCAFLAEKYDIPVSNIICHAEGNRQGIASGHADVEHWWHKHGYSMNGLRSEVAAKLAAKKRPATTSPTKQTLYRVQVGSYANYDNAKNFLKEVQKTYPNAFIAKVEVEK